MTLGRWLNLAAWTLSGVLAAIMLWDFIRVERAARSAAQSPPPESKD